MLALGLGLFIGAERERRGKEAGVRTFAFTCLLGAIGGLLGTPFDYLVLLLVALLVVLLNIETLTTGHGVELTTSAALLVTGFTGLLAVQGHTFTPAALGIVTAALQAWKEPLSGFSSTLTEAELKSAVLLAIIAFIVYPTLPEGTVDPWGMVTPRDAWITVVLVAGIGFANYVLLKLFGARGIAVAGFLGGLVNSTVTAADLAKWGHEAGASLHGAVARGIVLTITAMLMRNALLLGVLAPSVLRVAAPFLLLMIVATVVVALQIRGERGGDEQAPQRMPTLTSPFSLTSALEFGLLFLALQIGEAIAHRLFGSSGVYAISAAGGVVSSAGAVAAAANLATTAQIATPVAAAATLAACMASAWISLPIIVRVGRTAALTRATLRALVAVTVLGAFGFWASRFMPLSG
jgi:uncharacterized membrane protein (DUF4010 family)